MAMCYVFSSDLVMCQEGSGYAYKLRFLEHVVLIQSFKITWLNAPFVHKSSSILPQAIK